MGMKKGKRRERKRPQKAEPTIEEYFASKKTIEECCIVVLYFCNYMDVLIPWFTSTQNF
jgi:hypothetical protein